jgi:hypothetical protein
MSKKKPAEPKKLPTVAERFAARRRKNRVVGICFLKDCKSEAKGKAYYCEEHQRELRLEQQRETVEAFYERAKAGEYVQRYVGKGFAPTKDAIEHPAHALRLLRLGALKLTGEAQLKYKQQLAAALS